MGREVRKVPPGWVHPKILGEGGILNRPMHDACFADAFDRWLAKFDRIRAENPLKLVSWMQVEGRPPVPDNYRPWQTEDATWFQLWETVSDGTPVSPPFATENELIVYLAVNGDLPDQKKAREDESRGSPGRKTGWGLDQAKAVVRTGWKPSATAA